MPDFAVILLGAKAATTPAEDSADLAIGLVAFAVIGIVYMLPTIVAIRRKHPHLIRVVLVNVLLGTTILGWIGALVDALRTPVPASSAASAKPTPATNAGPNTVVASPRRAANARSSNPFAFERDCPNCRSRIPMMAPVCPVCGYDLYAQAPSRR